MSVCACGDAKDNADEIVPVETASVEETEKVEEPVASVEETVEEPAEESADEDEAFDNNFTLGVTTETEYTNEYFGIGFKFPEGWTATPQEQIDAMNESILSLLEGEASDRITAALKNGSSLTDMAANNELNENILVGIENDGVVGLALSEENYLKICEDPAKEAIELLGITDITTEITDYEIAGIPTKALTLSGTLSVAIDDTNSVDLAIYEKMVVIKKKSYFALINATSVMNDNCDEYLSYFYALN